MFNKKNKIVLATLLIIFIYIFLFSSDKRKEKLLDIYYTGIDCINKEEYQEAQDVLSKLGDYKDSLYQIEIAKTLEKQRKIYDSAIEAFNNENYKNAIDLFSQIKDFKDSVYYIEESTELMVKKQVIESLYNEACDNYKTNNYILAIQNFTELNDYKDSKEHLQECRVELARLQQANTISAGIRYSTGIVSEGKIKYSGDYELLEEELSAWKDIISISLNGHLVIGLKQDGTVVVAGKIPDYPDYYIDTHTWKDIIAISSGQQYIVGLESDGTLVAQGHNGDEQLDINNWEDIVAISCGWRHTVGLDSNGNIKISGFQSEFQLNNINEHKDDWTNIIAISAAGGSSETSGRNAYTAALKQNGKVVTTLPDKIQEKINNWTDIVAISAGDFYLVGLTSNGDVLIQQVDYSVNLDDSIKEISNWNDIITISAGRGFTLAVNSKGKLFASGFYKDHQIDIDDWGDITCYEDEWKSIFDENLRWNGIN